MRLRKAIQVAIAVVTVVCVLASAAYSQGESVSEAKLPNGLTVLLKEDHATPVVCTFVWYRVGSRDEVTGVTGVSHQLEHMMFKGTLKEFPNPGYIDLLIGRHGGENNAFTTSDYTAYFLLLPSDQLSLALKIEADRMTNAAIDPKQLASEKTVVLSELEGSNNDNAGFLYDNARATAYQYHPYHYPVIGTKWDVEHFTRDEVYAYYRRHYAPNDATLVVVGDFNTSATLAEIRSLWRDVKPANVKERAVDPEPPQRGERRIEIKRAGSTGYLQYMYHIPNALSSDLAPLTVLATALGNGRSSRLYKALVESQIATSVSASANQGRDPELFEIAVSLNAAVAAPAAEKLVDEALGRVHTKLIDDHELQKVKNQTRADFIYANDSVEQQSSRLGFYQTVTGSWTKARRFLDEVSAVTAADVKRVADTYLIADNRTVGVFVPTAVVPHATTDSPTDRAAHYRRSATPSGPLPPVQSVSTFTCELRPTPATRQHDGKSFVEHMLPNGVKLLVRENHSNPTVAISGFVRVGSEDDPPGKQGLADVTAKLLDRGVVGLNSQQIAESLEFVGSSVEFPAGRERTDLSARSLSENFKATLSILARCLVHPTYPASEVTKVVGETVSEIKVESTDPPSVATRGLYDLIYPPGDSFRHMPIGTVESVQRITRDDVAAFYAKHYSPDSTTLVIVGDVDANTVLRDAEEVLGDWKSPAPPKSSQDAASQPPASQGREEVITIPDKEQGEIAMGFPGVSRTSPDYVAASLMNLILGGDQFVGRVGKRVRDTEGLAYYAYTAFFTAKHCGPWMFRAGVNPTNVRHAIRSAKEEIARMVASGVTDAELAWAKDHTIGALALKISTNIGMAGELANDDFYDPGRDYLQRFPALVRSVTKAQVDAAAKKYLGNGSLDIVIAGPPLPSDPNR